jgi:pSer/pThr/pTyr-binding forkhead associated (FHA) protein
MIARAGRDTGSEPGIGGASAVLPPVGKAARALSNLPNPSAPVASPSSPSSSATVLGRARLTDHNAQRSYALTESTMVLGRDASCDITLDDANISRHHAQLSQDVVGTWKLTDLDSTNGTLLNGNVVTTALLRDGDQISVGMTVLEFREDR